MRNRIALLALTAMLIAACRPGRPTTTTTGTTTTATPAATTTTTAAIDLADLIAAAQAEGTVTTIALPRDLCNYGNLIEGFKAKYGLEVNELNPAANSADELEAIRASAGSQAPDVIDVWVSFGPDAQAEGLITPYKVSTWETIPDVAKDPDGFWYGGYYGVLAFEVNAHLVAKVPARWADLLDPIYEGQVALAGDPRVSNQAIFSVYAAALANGGSVDNAQPGLDFFAELNSVGNLSQVISDSETVASGQTPLAIRWTYNALANRVTNQDLVPIEVVVPATGRLVGLYVQAISANAPHPNAAKLWMEYLFSDEGQLGWLIGYCHPIRYTYLLAGGKIPADLASAVPSLEGSWFPTPDQISAATELITTQWDSVVGVNVGGG